MPGAGAGKRRSAPGMTTSNSNATGRGGGTANETQAPNSPSVVSGSVSNVPPSASTAAVAATTNPPAAPAPASQPHSTAPPAATSPPGVTPASVSPSRSLHSSHSPSHHRTSTRHRLVQALGLLQRQQRLLQSVLRTTPEGPPASRGGDHHRREKWGAVTPKGSKSPSAKRKTGSSSATDVRRTRKRSRKNKKRKTVQGVEA